MCLDNHSISKTSLLIHQLSVTKMLMGQQYKAQSHLPPALETALLVTSTAVDTYYADLEVM